MNTRPVVITGIGIVSAAGANPGAVWDSIRAGRSGLRPLRHPQTVRWEGLLAGEITDDLALLGAPRFGSRSDKLATIAARQALGGAGLIPSDRGALAGMGVVLGASTGGVLGTEEAFIAWIKRREFHPRLLRWHECASSAEACARLFGLGGPTATLSTACSSGALAIALAADLIASGEADLMLAGGTDSLCRLTINGFNSLLLVDPAGCRPFDAGRAGMSLGEGAAALVLEEEGSARRRGARVLARLSGWGASCDAHHATAPHPEGRGALAAMRAAAERAGLPPEEIDYVNAHGTGTPDNDMAEGAAMRAFFGDRVPPFSSVKRFFGHTLAASGAIEAVVCVQALLEGALPPNLGFESVDPQIGLAPIAEMKPLAARHVLSNSFGFGGNNAALLFSGAQNPKSKIQNLKSAARAGAAVAGIGLVGAAGSTIEEFYAALRAGGIAPEIVALKAPLPEGEAAAYRAKDIPAKEELDAAKRRRLNRVLQMAVIAARRARRSGGLEGAGGERAAVCIGTGRGCIGDTTAFIENMIANDERAPMPARFINSVHNAPAAQAAMELDARGLNSAPVHGEISFEIGLWQAIGELTAGRADVAYAGAADELIDHELALGMKLGWWHRKSAPVRPFAAGDPSRARERPLPGEGAAVVVLAPIAIATAPLAIVSACAFGRHRRLNRRRIDATHTADWIERTLARDGIDLAEIDAVMAGANGSPRMDQMHRDVVDELSRRAGRPIALAAHKQACGEFAAASALGFVAAVGLVRGEIALKDVRFDQAPDDGSSCRRVLLFTIAPAGACAMCVVSAVG